MTVYVAIHFVSFEGEIGEMLVFSEKARAEAWVAEFVVDASEQGHSWREIFEKQVQ